MRFVMGEGVYGTIVTLCMYLGALSGFVVSLLFGIFALVPIDPFDEKNLSLGISLVVITGVGLSAIIGGLVGVCLGCLVASPVLLWEDV